MYVCVCVYVYTCGMFPSPYNSVTGAVLSSNCLRLTAFLWSCRRYSLLSRKKNGNHDVFQWKDSKGKLGQMDVALVVALTSTVNDFCL